MDGGSVEAIDHSTHWSAAAAVVLSVGLLAAVANFTIICAILQPWLHRKQTNIKLSIVDIFVINIAAADFTHTGGNALSLLISGGNLYNSWPATYLSTFFTVASGASALFMILGLAFTRYRYIMDRHLARTQIPDSTVKKAIVMVWAVCVSLAIVIIASGTAHQGQHGLTGSFDIPLPGAESRNVRHIFIIVCTFVPPSGIYWLHRQMIQIIKTDTIDEAVSRKVVRMIFLLNLVYFTTLLPLGTLQVYRLISGDGSELALEAVFYVIAFSNSLANPLIYCSSQQKYQSAVLKLPGVRYLCSKLGVSVSSTRTSSDRAMKSNNRSGNVSGRLAPLRATKDLPNASEDGVASSASVARLADSAQSYAEVSNDEDVDSKPAQALGSV